MSGYATSLSPSCQAPESHSPAPTPTLGGAVIHLDDYRQRKLTLKKPRRFLLDESFSQQQMSLAAALARHSSKGIGRNASEILLKLFGIMLSCGWGPVWMSRAGWQHPANLPWISERGIRTAINFLVREGILLRTYDRFKRNRSVYEISFSRLNDFVDVPVRWLEKEREIKGAHEQEMGVVTQEEECEKEQEEEQVSPIVSSRLAVTNDSGKLDHSVTSNCDKRSSSSIYTQIPNLDNKNLDSYSEEKQFFFTKIEDKKEDKKEEEKTVVERGQGTPDFHSTNPVLERSAPNETSAKSTDTPKIVEPAQPARPHLSLAEMTLAYRDRYRAEKEQRLNGGSGYAQR